MRIDEKLDQVMDSLQVLAVQKNEISHIVSTLADHRNWLKNHEERLQTTEKEPGKLAGKVVLVLSGAGATFVVSLVLWALTKGS